MRQLQWRELVEHPGDAPFLGGRGQASLADLSAYVTVVIPHLMAMSGDTVFLDDPRCWRGVAGCRRIYPTIRWSCPIIYWNARCLECAATPLKNPEWRKPVESKVKIVDIDMPFWSMVGFMVKAAIAAIPAFMILVSLWFMSVFLFGLVFDTWMV